MWGTHSDKVDPITGDVTQTAEEGRHQYVGKADIAFMKQQGVSDTDIYEHVAEHGLKNPDGSYDYDMMHENIEQGATITSQGEAITDLGGKYTTLEGDYRNLSEQYLSLIHI